MKSSAMVVSNMEHLQYNIADMEVWSNISIDRPHFRRTWGDTVGDIIRVFQSCLQEIGFPYIVQ
jgi:hypothetical protein